MWRIADWFLIITAVFAVLLLTGPGVSVAIAAVFTGVGMPLAIWIASSVHISASFGAWRAAYCILRRWHFPGWMVLVSSLLCAVTVFLVADHILRGGFEDLSYKRYVSSEFSPEPITVPSTSRIALLLPGGRSSSGTCNATCRRLLSFKEIDEVANIWTKPDGNIQGAEVFLTRRSKGACPPPIGKRRQPPKESGGGPCQYYDGLVPETYIEIARLPKSELPLADDVLAIYRLRIHSREAIQETHLVHARIRNRRGGLLDWENQFGFDGRRLFAPGSTYAIETAFGMLERGTPKVSEDHIELWLEKVVQRLTFSSF